MGGWAAVLAGCSSADNPPPATNPATTPTGKDATTANRILLAYFSRPGENYYYGGRRDLQVGSTEVCSRMIAELIDCDVYRINAADPYPASCDATVARNIREQDTDARPAIADPLASIETYDTVLLGSPIWNVRPPMIMTTFTQPTPALYAPPTEVQLANGRTPQKWRASSHSIGGRYSTERFAAASTSSGVKSTTVRTLAPPASLTASANAAALSLSGSSATAKASWSPKAK